MSEHQELIAALAHIGQGQKQIIDAINNLAEVLKASDVEVEFAKAGQAESIKVSMEGTLAGPDEYHVNASKYETLVNNPTNPAHAVKHDDPTPSEDDLKKALMAYSKKTSREQAKALLEKYDSKKVSDVPEAMRAMLIQQMEG